MSIQINKMNLYIDDGIFLRSYKTTIGVLDNVWNITTKKYSITTDRQIAKFTRIMASNNIITREIGQYEVKRVSQDELLALITSIKTIKKD